VSAALIFVSFPRSDGCSRTGSLASLVGSPRLFPSQNNKKVPMKFRRSHLNIALRVCSLFLIFAIVTGCGGSKKGGDISGKVEYQGNPVTGGKIKFHPTGGGTPVESGIDPNGNYTVSGVPVGKNKVTIDTSSVKSDMEKMSQKGMGTMPAGPDPSLMKDVPAGKKAPEGMPEMKSFMPKYVKIPDQYADVNKTPLEMEVKRGNQKKDFVLTD
jgi:hypothetical protein